MASCAEPSGAAQCGHSGLHAGRQQQTAHHRRSGLQRGTVQQRGISRHVLAEVVVCSIRCLADYRASVCGRCRSPRWPYSCHWGPNSICSTFQRGGGGPAGLCVYQRPYAELHSLRSMRCGQPSGWKRDCAGWLELDNRVFFHRGCQPVAAELESESFLWPLADCSVRCYCRCAAQRGDCCCGWLWCIACCIGHCGIVSAFQSAMDCGGTSGCSAWVCHRRPAAIQECDLCWLACRPYLDRCPAVLVGYNGSAAHNDYDLHCQHNNY